MFAAKLAAASLFIATLALPVASRADVRATTLASPPPNHLMTGQAHLDHSFMDLARLDRLARMSAETVRDRSPSSPPSGDAASNAEPCFFGQHRVLSVSPVNAEEPRGKASVSRPGGAELYVQAEPGLTAERLRLELARQSKNAGDCPFAMASVRTEVDSAGSGFRVRVLASDPQTAREVLRRSRLMVS
jgi:hypothetical protein